MAAAAAVGVLLSVTPLSGSGAISAQGGASVGGAEAADGSRSTR